MEPDGKRILHKHHLRHIPELRVGDSIVTAKFAAGCSMTNCDAACCMYGFFADVREYDNILAHVDIIQRHMEPHQAKDPAVWFDEQELVDPDFPSGRAIGTHAMDYGCVFLDKAGKCTLQKAATAEGMYPFALKPFYCVAYPITVDHGELMLDEPEFTDRPRCCRATSGGTKDIFDVCAEELTFVLGTPGVEELRTLVEAVNGKTSFPQ